MARKLSPIMLAALKTIGDNGGFYSDTESVIKPNTKAALIERGLITETYPADLDLTDAGWAAYNETRQETWHAAMDERDTSIGAERDKVRQIMADAVDVPVSLVAPMEYPHISSGDWGAIEAGYAEISDFDHLRESDALSLAAEPKKRRLPRAPKQKGWKGGRKSVDKASIRKSLRTPGAVARQIRKAHREMGLTTS